MQKKKILWRVTGHFSCIFSVPWLAYTLKGRSYLYRARLLPGVIAVVSACTVLNPSLPLHSSVCLQWPCSQFYSTADLLTLRNEGRAFSRLFPKPTGKSHTLILHCLLQLCLPGTFKYIYMFVLNHCISMISNIKRHNIEVVLFPRMVRKIANKLQPSLEYSIFLSESFLCVLWVSGNLSCYKNCLP